MNVPAWVRVLPHINAGLNAASCVLLVTGLMLIRRGKKTAHATVMISTFIASTAFLACYLTYHQALFHYTGSGSAGFQGTGLLRQAYLTMLISHSTLAALVPFLALRMFYLAWKERWRSHKKLGRFTFPIWLYVSTTGVIIYLVLYHMPLGPGH